MTGGKFEGGAKVLTFTKKKQKDNSMFLLVNDSFMILSILIRLDSGVFARSSL